MSNILRVVLLGAATGEQVGEYMSPILPHMGDTIQLNNVAYDVLNVVHIVQPVYSTIWRGGVEDCLSHIEIDVLMSGEL